MIASYTPIVGHPALTVGLFAQGAGGVPVKWETQKLQKRDKHQEAKGWFAKRASLTEEPAAPEINSVLLA